MSRAGPQGYIGITAQRNTEDAKMTTPNLLKSLLISALLASATAKAAEQQPIVIAMEQGKQIASFNVGDSRCVLKNDQIRCAPVNIK
jgi:serine/threonine protein phosphatase PrpC